jgi:N-terminal half of MaoC dehydratase
VTPELRELIGREWDPVIYEVDGPGIRMWARAVGFDDPAFYDEEVAHTRGFEHLPAPPGFVGWPRTRPGAPDPGPPIRGLHPDLVRSLHGGTESSTGHRSWRATSWSRQLKSSISNSGLDRSGRCS